MPFDLWRRIVIEFISAPIPPLETRRPADPHAAGLLRALCGVDRRHPVIELVASRIKFRATTDCVVSIAGTVFRLKNGNRLFLKKGEFVELSPSGNGYRDYLIAQIPETKMERKWLSWTNFDDVETGTIRVGVGPEFTPGSLDGEFIVDSRSNRIGLRLSRVEPQTFPSEEMITCPVGWGTIQMPPDGNPIILLPDAQSTGGYPRIGWVVPQDLWIVGQLKPGSVLRFNV
jgi:allophanate hydrolase subunit 2